MNLHQFRLGPSQISDRSHDLHQPACIRLSDPVEIDVEFDSRMFDQRTVQKPEPVECCSDSQTEHDEVKGFANILNFIKAPCFRRGIHKLGLNEGHLWLNGDQIPGRTEYRQQDRNDRSC